MDERRLFSEQEATKLIVEAAKMQESGPESAEYTPGVDFGELKRMAADLGVKEEYLVRAVSRLGTGSDGKDVRKTFMGFPLSMEFERVIEGELPPENFDIVTQEVGEVAYSNIGQQAISQVGRGLSVKFMQGLVTGAIGVQSRGGRTRLTCTAKSELGATFAILGALIGFVPVLAGASTSGPTALVAWLLFSALWVYLFGAFTGRSYDRAHERVERIAKQIADENSSLRSSLAAGGPVAAEAEASEEVHTHE